MVVNHECGRGDKCCRLSDPNEIPPQSERPYCRFPRWSIDDQMWICCHGGGACGGCSAYPQNCKPAKSFMEDENSEPYWDEKIKTQALVEKTQDWKFCPWCGTQLVINPKYHICGTNEWPD